MEDSTQQCLASLEVTVQQGRLGLVLSNCRERAVVFSVRKSDGKAGHEYQAKHAGVMPGDIITSISGADCL